MKVKDKGPRTRSERSRPAVAPLRAATGSRPSRPALSPSSLFGGLADAVADGILTIDDKGKIQGCNTSAGLLFGYRVRDVVGKPIDLLFPRPKGNDTGKSIHQFLARRGPSAGVYRCDANGRRKDGTLVPLVLSLGRSMAEKRRLVTAVIHDPAMDARPDRRTNADGIRPLGDRRALSRAAEERRNFEDRLRLAATVIETANEAVVIADSQFNVTSVNPAFTEITGYGAEDVIGKQPPFLEVLKADPVNHAKMRKAIQRLGHWEGEIWNKRKNGDDYAERLSISSINDDDGRVRQYAALIGDITKRKQDEERIRYQANFDSLTGLPNRTLFVDRLTQALVAMGRKGKKLALMFIDLDGFKLVNDTMGHDIGDLLLKEAAVRLSACVRSGDTVARLGGDEFTVIMPDLADPRNAPMVAQRALDSLAKPFILEGQEAFVSGSIGITIFPDDAADSNELLRNADAAMYRAKERGKANYQFFTADLNEEVRQRLILRNNLVKAIERNELTLHFQPKIELKTRKITGLEALMRWNNAELGSVPPSRFIPVLEETGMALEFGRWIVQAALDQYKAVVAAGLPPLRIAINLTTRQLREPRFVALIERALSDNKLSPESLEIEVTEMMLMSDASRNVTALGKLHDLGIHIAMDDFGTGYSSLVYLKRYPIDTIKIDRSFIANIAKDPDDAEVVRAIIGMGQSLRRRVAAEGVETEEQLDLLTAYACDEAQGYVIAPPLADDDLIKYLKKNIT